MATHPDAPASPKRSTGIRSRNAYRNRFTCGAISTQPLHVITWVITLQRAVPLRPGNHRAPPARRDPGAVTFSFSVRSSASLVIG